MAKNVTISQAEYEYMKTVITHDGMAIARLEAELSQAKEDIKALLHMPYNSRACTYCKVNPQECEDCELQAEWRGWKG